MCTGVSSVCLSVQLNMHFIGNSTDSDTSTEKWAVTRSQPHPGPAALRLSGFRSQSYEMAHSPAAQHAPLFICVCCGAVMSVLGLGLLAAFWPSACDRKKERERFSITDPLQSYVGVVEATRRQRNTDLFNMWQRGNKHHRDKHLSNSLGDQIQVKQLKSDSYFGDECTVTASLYCFHSLNDVVVLPYLGLFCVCTGSSYRCRPGGEWSRSVQDPHW